VVLCACLQAQEEEDVARLVHDMQDDDDLGSAGNHLDGEEAEEAASWASSPAARRPGAREARELGSGDEERAFFDGGRARSQAQVRAPVLCRAVLCCAVVASLGLGSLWNKPPAGLPGHDLYSCTHWMN
jgi:hypothetical protein